MASKYTTYAQFEEISAPTAASNNGVVYVKADGHLYFSSVGGSGGTVSETKISDNAASSLAADDISAGDAAVSIETTVGNITIDAQATDADVIIKVDDNGSSVTAVTFDGSDEGNAIFVNDLKLSSDAAAIYFGANNEIKLWHNHDAGLVLQTTATGDSDATSGYPVLTLASSEAEIASGEILGAVTFNALGESSGTDANATAGAIVCIATDTFAADNNAASLHFATGDSAEASSKMNLGSTGILTLNGSAGAIIIPDAGNIGSASDPNAIAISSGGVVAVTATTANTSASDGALTVAGGAGIAADLSVGDDLRLISDSAVLSFGASSDIKITHYVNTGLAITGSHANGTNLRINNDASDGDSRVEFQLNGTTVWSVGVEDGDSDKFVIEDGTGVLGADPAFEIASDKSAKFYGTLEATTSFTIGSAAMSEADLEQLDGITAGTAAASKAVVLDGSKNIATIGTVGCGAITSTGNSSMVQLTTSGRVIVDDTTAATSTTDGSLQTDGGLSVALGAVVGEDLYLLSDSAVIHFGANSDITLAHNADYGLTLEQPTDAASEPVLTLKSVGDFVSGSILHFVLDNDSGEGAYDCMGLIKFTGDNAADEATEFCVIRAMEHTITNGAEAGSIIMSALVAGTSRDILTVGGGAGITLPNDATYGVAKANAFVTYSDETLKENIKPMAYALDKVRSLQGVTYNWKGDGKSDIGFIAQEVEKVVPEVVQTTGEEGGYAMDYSRMTALLVEGMKEQQVQIDDLMRQLKN